jgi:uncharacterized OsmC-like protein
LAPTISLDTAVGENLVMSLQNIAAALERVESVMRRRPDLAMHEDALATARWQGGTRVMSSHANGMQVACDMPTELGGSGDQVTPGWLFRAGLAACAVTSITMAAAAQGIELGMVEVKASSRSDVRGLLGMADAEGQLLYAGPHDLALSVHISAPGVTPGRLRALVEHGIRCSPIPNAVQTANPLPLRIVVDAA